MSIRYITTGDEKIARSLLGEGRHQLTILKNSMTFQGLKQLQRAVRFDDDTIIKCWSCFGQDVVSIHVQQEIIPAKKEAEIPVLAEGIVIAVFYFRLTRDDGIEITEESGLLESLKIYNSHKVPLAIEKEYNTETGYWEVTLINPEDDIDKKGYWATYSCKCGVKTQYPGRIIEENKWNEGDLIRADKKYDDIILSRCFQIKVIRDIDGVVMTPAVVPYFRISWKNPLGYSDTAYYGQGNEALGYDSDAASPTYQHWLFEIDELKFDPAGCWISFVGIPLSVGCQHPKRCRAIDKGKTEDLVQHGKHEMAAPYWEIMDSHSDSPEFVTVSSQITCAERLSIPHSFDGHYYTTQFSVTKTREIVCSIPYRVRSHFNYGPGHGWVSGVGHIFGWGAFTGTYGDSDECPATTTAVACASFNGESLTVSGGGLSVNLDISILEDVIQVSAVGYSYGSDGGSHSVTISVTPGTGEYLDQCYDGDGNHYEQTLIVPGDKLYMRSPLSHFIGLSFNYDW